MSFIGDAIHKYRMANNPVYRKAFDAALARANLPEGSYDLAAMFGEDSSVSGIPLGTARWMAPAVAAEKFCISIDHYKKGFAPFWFGKNFVVDGKVRYLGYHDDRHVCVVSGSRGGKGVGVIIPNLCTWPGSSIIVDPKGENATVTAQRRGQGSIYSEGLGQKVCILDPFQEVQVPGIVRAHYNPLDTIDPASDLAIDDAGRIAAAIIVPQNQNDPYWEEAARSLVKGLILHVVSAGYLASYRNLVGVRRLLTQGDWLTVENLRQNGSKEIPSSFEILWGRLKRNPAFNGVVAGVGEQMISMSEKTRSGVLEAARTNTEFLDSMPMQRLLEKSDFSLSELKTSPKGLTIYLTLPQRFMATHYRWLRLMISLSIGEMERLKGRPKNVFPVLFLLDEFAGLKRMEVIENAAAQAAGFGVKFCFVVQNLAQLKEVYKESWETFLGNSGLKLFFQIDDQFTRSYISSQLGEMETTRQTQSGSQSSSTSSSNTGGQSSSVNYGKSTSRRPILGFRTSRSASSGTSTSSSWSTSQGYSSSTTAGWGEAIHKRPLLTPDEVGRMLARIDDRSRPGYPGLVLGLIPGELPVLARRQIYFEDFKGAFDPHPDHPPPPTLAQSAAAPIQASSPTVTTSRPSKSSRRQTIGKWIFGTVLILAASPPIIALLMSFFRGTASQSDTKAVDPFFKSGSQRHKVVNSFFTLTRNSSVYQSPDSSSSIVGHVHRHRGVHVTGIANGWLQIKLLDGTVGYIPDSVVDPFTMSGRLE